jgi:hypothetical protein
MSYSFSVRAADKAAAKTAVSAELARVVSQQPVHAADSAAAEAAAGAQIDLLVDDGNRDVFVSVSGSLGGSWSDAGEITEVSSANVSVNASLVAKETI